MSTKLQVVKTEDEKDRESAQNEIIEAAVENFLPMIQPLIKPATKKFTEFMVDGNVILIRAVKGRVYIFHMKAEDVEKFELKEGKEAVGTYSVDEFVNQLLTGGFSNL